MASYQGGCLRGALRYETMGEPHRIVFCHCRFCQRATGTAYLLDAMFARSNFNITKGVPSRYELTSEGSGKKVVVNFCSRCGTKIFLDLDRVPNDIGLYTGTYDNPNWFERLGANSKHLFLDYAQRDTLIHPGLPVFREHVTTKGGTPTTATTFEKPYQVG